MIVNSVLVHAPKSKHFAVGLILDERALETVQVGVVAWPVGVH